MLNKMAIKFATCSENKLLVYSILICTSILLCIGASIALAVNGIYNAAGPIGILIGLDLVLFDKVINARNNMRKLQVWNHRLPAHKARFAISSLSIDTLNDHVSVGDIVVSIVSSNVSGYRYGKDGWLYIGYISTGV